MSAPPTNDVPLLEARGVGVEFTTRAGTVATALDGVDVEVRAGEILALVGESGSGKTTLARTLVGAAAPHRGRGAVRGRAPVLLAPSACGRSAGDVQMVLQDAAGSLNPRQTVYESVAEGIRLQKRVAGDPEGRTEVELVAAALAEAGLRPPERIFLRYPHELSGGQKQRVLIAGALALRPRLLVADEPVSSLDASIRGEILALLLGLRESLGLGIVVVTHDVGLAWNIADRIAVMYLGRVVECGTTEEILRVAAASRTRRPCSRSCRRSSSSRRSCSRGRCPTRPASRVAAGSTRAARRSPTARRPTPGSTTTAVRPPLPVLAATGDHRVACHLVNRPDSWDDSTTDSRISKETQ